MTERRRGEAAGTLARWTVSAGIVLGLHAGAVWTALRWQDARASTAGSAPPVVMVDLAPAEPPEPGPEMTPQAVDTPAPEPESPPPAPPEPPRAEPEPDPTPPEPDPPEPNAPEPTEAAAPVDPLPEPSPPSEAAAVLTLPPRPPAARPEPPRERKRPPVPVRPTPRPPPAAAASPARPPAATMPGVAATPSVAPAQWRSSVGSHIRRFVAAPPGARTGSVRVAITFDRTGRILSAQVAQSSGQEALDQQALRNVRSASPIPAPPPEQGLTLTVPIQFNIR